MLLLLAIAFGRLWEVRAATAVLLAIFVAVGVLTARMDLLNSVCVVESGYFCIRVSEQQEAGRTVSVLTLDKLVHSYVDLDDPTFLVYGYEKVLGDLSTYVGWKDPQFRSLFIGGGGYTMPRFIESRFPESVVEVVEIDPAVTEVVHEYFGMPRDTRIVTYNEDARTKFLDLPEGEYDLIVGDAFDHFSVPYHLTTLEFNERVEELLKDGGLYTLNVVDKLHKGRFLRAVVHTLRADFRLRLRYEVQRQLGYETCATRTSWRRRTRLSPLRGDRGGQRARRAGPSRSSTSCPPAPSGTGFRSEGEHPPDGRLRARRQPACAAFREDG